MKMTAGDRERFQNKVGPTDENGCWPWAGTLHQWGYGRFHLNGGNRNAHRVAWVMENGPIPEGLYIDHLCRNRKCVNPEHLEAVTNRENILRGTAPAALNSRKRVCLRGHEYTDDNTYVTPTGARKCRTCERARWKRKNLLRRAA
jgi:hypothetical protein